MRRLSLLFALITALVLPAQVQAFDGDDANRHLQSLWLHYKARFVEENGRVVDTANGAISHSEGQGYVMLLAVAMDDRDTFERAWAWTRQTLGVRDDDLFAWVYDPQTSSIRDPNNATDGDLLIAWALERASQAWDVPAYRHAARTLSDAMLRHATTDTDGYGRMILPGVDGFSPQERSNGAVYNLSYWVFPALDDLSNLLGPATSDSLTASGLKLLEDARFGAHNLPPDWVAIPGSQPASDPLIADGFEPVFGYNAIRIPLYLVWAGAGARVHLAPFVALWPQDEATVAQVHLVTGNHEPLVAAGYQAVAALTTCAMQGAMESSADSQSLHTSFGAPLDTDYYPATLHLLSLLALHERGLAC